MGTFPLTTVETTRPQLLTGASPITSVQRGSPPAVERNPISAAAHSRDESGGRPRQRDIGPSRLPRHDTPPLP